MQVGTKTRQPELAALLIAPDRELARQFSASLERSPGFKIVSDLKSYPSEQTLDLRLRQFKPDVVLLDLATDLDSACELIRLIGSLGPSVHMVGLHTTNDSQAILQSLRAGATEFLYAPFEEAIQQQALSRLHRLREPVATVAAQPGRIVVFASAKPGSGASTLAAQTAFSLRKSTGKRVLLADFDLLGGMIGFYLKLSHTQSLVEALEHADHLDSAMWSSLVSDCGGVDILPAPETPYAGAVDAGRLHAVLDFARMSYDWLIVDLPVIFQRLSLMTVSEADRAFLVSTSELPSLHLARKAVNLLNQLGFPKERFQILVNRINKRDDIAVSDMEKLFNCSVHSRFPNDYFSVHRAVTLGQPVDGHCELGKAIDTLAGRLTGHAVAGRKKAAEAELGPVAALARA
jgi:pilus assembly protein CpaE